MTERVRETYRGADLIARRYGQVVRGKAWRAGRELGSLEGGSEEQVLSSLRAMVDAAFTVEVNRGDAPYPDANSYREAFTALAGRLPVTYRAMLRAHYNAPDRILTAGELAAAADYPKWTSANLHYGLLGKMVGEFLLFQPRSRKTGEPIWTLMLADGVDEAVPEEEWRWQMRPQVAEALHRAGLV